MRPILTAIFCFALTGLAAASIVLKLDLPGLVERSEVIVEGRCVATRAHRDELGGIATEVSFRVEQGYRGAAAGRLIRFSVPGGELDGKAFVIPGVPVFRPGDEVLVFLTRETARGIRMPVGLGQGRLFIERDPATGARRLRRPLAHTHLIDPVTGQAVPEPPDEPIDYARFTADVRSLVEAGR